MADGRNPIWDTLRVTPEEQAERDRIAREVSKMGMNVAPGEQYAAEYTQNMGTSVATPFPIPEGNAFTQVTQAAPTGKNAFAEFLNDPVESPKVNAFAEFLEDDPNAKPEATWADVGRAIAPTAWGGIKQSTGGIVQAAGDLIRNEGWSETGAELAAEGSAEAKAAQPEGEMSFWKRATLGGISSVLQQLPTLAASIATMSPLPALAGAGAMAGGSTYAEAREAGHGGARAAGHAAIDTTVEVLFERIPVGFLMRSLSGKSDVTKIILGLYAREVPTEVLTTAVQSANAKFNNRPEMTLEDYWDDIGDTIGSTMVSTPLLGGAAAAMRGVTRPADREIPESEKPFTPPAVETEKDHVVNSQLTTPSIDHSTNIIPSADKERMTEEYLAIDPEKITEKELEEDRKVLAEAAAKQHAPPIPDAHMHWTNLTLAPQQKVDIGELSTTVRQANNAQNYINPNTGDRLKRRFSYATDEAAIGLTPEQILPKPGTYGLGEFTEDRPESMMIPLIDSLENWRQKWMPDAVFVVSNEQLLTDSALGWHYSLGDKKHMIVPAVLRKMKDPTKFNVNTQAGVFYNLAHEFSHALFIDRLLEQVPEVNRKALRDRGEKGIVPEELLQGMDPLAADVIREYNAIRQRIDSGDMSAQEAIDVWFGPAKKGRKFLEDLNVSPNAPAKAIRTAAVARAVANSRLGEEMTAQDLKAKLTADFFSLEEYFAEQGSRYAYAREQDIKTPLGRFLKAGVDSLRKFFTGLKADGIIAPGVKFQEWMDGLPRHSRLAQEAKHVSDTKKNAGKKAAEIKVRKAPKKKVETRPKAKRVAHNVNTDTSLPWAQKARGQITNLIRTGVITKEDSIYDELMERIKADDRDEVIDILRDLTGKTIKFQPNSGIAKDKNWATDHFDSPGFRAWFGDWRDNPEEASMVREGAFRTLNDGTLMFDVSTDGPPLVAFTSLEKLQKGQNAFYISTLRGAHYTEAALGEISDPSMVPVVLNIRNPYIVADLLTPAPPIAELRQQGYDGIVYRNDFEGDTTFVVFDPGQIKMLPDRRGIHMEPDYDAATPEGRGASRLYDGIKNFVPDQNILRKALRFATKVTQYTLQLQQHDQIRPHLKDSLGFMVEINTNFVRYGAQRRAGADEILSRWKGTDGYIGKRNQQRINKTLIRQMESGERWFDLVYTNPDGTPTTKLREGKLISWPKLIMTERAKQELKKDGIDVDTDVGAKLGELVLDIDNSLLDYLNEDEMVLLNMVQYRFRHQERNRKSAERDLKKHISELRKRPFFPQGLFGPYMITVQRPTESGGGYETTWKQAFESKGEWEKATNDIKAKIQKAGSDEIVRPYELRGKEYVLMTLPRDFLDTMAAELDLKDEQIDTLVQLLQPVKTERLLKQHEQVTKGIKGYTADAMRSYANFTWHHSNAQAKLRYRGEFNLAIESMRQKLRDAQFDQNFDQMNEYQVVLDAMEKARDYIMSPPAEAHTARALVSLAYLGLNVKTAALNLYGLVTVWSDLISKHGVLSAHRRFAQAAKWSAQSMMLGDLNKRRKGEYIPKDLMKALDRAIEEGVLSQSYAYHLAGMANQGTLARMPLVERFGPISQRAMDVAMYPFRLTELATRRIAFLTAMQERLDKNVDFETAYTEAVAQVNKLQNDYSHGNRVPFMRGQRGVFGSVIPLATVFMSFAQHMAFHGYGGYELGQRRAKTLDLNEKLAKGEISQKEFDAQIPKWFQWGYGYTARLWLLTLALAGYEGLPGMENILDIIDSIWRRLLGNKPIRQELREMVRSVNGDPQFWARGLGHDVFGFDISRSVGFGRIVPGTDELAKGADATPTELVGGLAFNLFGATGGLLKWGLTTLGNDKSFSDQMQKFPGGVGNIWSAYNWWNEGGPTGPVRNRIALERQPDGSMRPRDLSSVEIAGKALGFNPKIISENRELLWADHDIKQYWISRATGLRRDYRLAALDGDKEALEDAKKAISEFNEEVRADEEFRQLAIKPIDLQRAVRADMTKRRTMERGLPIERKFRPTSEALRRSFEPPEGEP
jgi:hypothetical protein